MTTLVILLLGYGAVLIVSAIESNADGSDVSVMQTISDIWNDKVDVHKGNTPPSTAPPGNNPPVPGPGLPAQIPGAPMPANANATGQIQGGAL